MKYFSNKVIDSSVLLDNFLALKQKSKKDICAVVKANAYGHNACAVVKVLNNVCNFFAVQNLYEALEIKKFTNKKILVLGYTINYLLASKNNIVVTIDCLSELKKLENLDIKIHLKINTGMNRFGIKTKKDLFDILDYLKNHKNIVLDGVYTHFFDTSNKKIVKKQISQLKSFVKIIDQNVCVHVGGSNMINFCPDFASFVRCGLFLYGYQNKITKPCMKIESRVVKITKVNKGEYVGYDSFFLTNKNMKIALIPLGYADGIIRNFQKEMFVLFNGQKLNVVGKICMDCFMVDVTNVNIKLNDTVIVFCDASMWAKKSNLSEYEILTNLNNSRTNIKVI